MRRETELFVAAIVREDRSILDFLDGNFTFLNERLARHYGIDGVTGTEFRRVALPATASAAACITQASVLTVSSYATRTSPVLRGSWILDNILGGAAARAAARRPEPRRQGGRRRARRCGSSSSSIAPIRPARRATSGWIRSASASRTSTPSAPGGRIDGKVPIDASGTLPDGRVVQRARRSCGPSCAPSASAFTRAITGKLMTYALGRGLERTDRRDAEEDGRGHRRRPAIASPAWCCRSSTAPPSRCGAPRPKPAPAAESRRHADRATVIPRSLTQDRGAPPRDPFAGARHDDHHRQAPLPTDDPARPGRDGGAARARRDDAGAGRGGRAQAGAAAPARLRLRAERRDDGATGRRRPRARASSCRASSSRSAPVEGSDAGAVRPRARQRQRPRRRPRRSRPRRRRVPDRRPLPQDGRRRHQERRLGRPDRRPPDRPADAPRLDRAGLRGHAHRRQLRLRLQLRLHQQPVVAQRDHAAAARDQPARGVRAPVRRRRRPRSGDAGAAPAHPPQHPRPRRRAQRGAAQRSRRQRSPQAGRVPHRRPRDRAAHRAGRGAQHASGCRRWRSRAASPRRSPSTSR